MSGHWIGRSGSRIRSGGTGWTAGRYTRLAWPFSPAAFQLAGRDKIAQRDGFFLAKKSGWLFEPVEWDIGFEIIHRPPPASDQLRGRSMGGLETGFDGERKKGYGGQLPFFLSLFLSLLQLFSPALIGNVFPVPRLWLLEVWFLGFMEFNAVFGHF